MDAEPAKREPLTEIQCRVLGVLVEKAKTTPEQYPLSLNGLTTGCNQKSNRAPVMALHADDVQVTLDELRELGAVVEVQSSSRVAKYKHCLYDWLGVDKVEIAIVAELLLRGEQTVGELRGRAARMEPIRDLQALRPLLRSLVERGLVVELSPEGRGQIVTHGLLDESSLDVAKADVARVVAKQTSTASAGPSSPTPGDSAIQVLEEQIRQLHERVSQLESIVLK